MTNYNSSLTNTNVDSVMSELLAEASRWVTETGSVREKNGLKNGKNKQAESKISAEDASRDSCLDQIARAITAHVADVLMQRLGIQEEATMNNSILTPGSSRTVSPNVVVAQQIQGVLTPRQHRSLLQMKTANEDVTTVRTPPRSSRTVSRNGSQSNLAAASHFHSENRLDRSMPAPLTNEGPLENRASRLRKMSLERKRLAGGATPHSPRSGSTSRRSSRAESVERYRM